MGIGNKGSETNKAVRDGNLLLNSMPPPEMRRLEKYIEVIEVGTGQKLAELDKPLEYVWFPHNCVTSTVVATEEGPYLEVGLMGAEGMVGLSLLFGEETSNSTVIVQVAGEASRMKAADFKSEVVTPNGQLFHLIQRYCNALCRCWHSRQFATPLILSTSACADGF